jgi:dihydrofolate reductase
LEQAAVRHARAADGQFHYPDVPRLPGSIALVRALLERDLVDELRLMVYPIVLGNGERLFATMPDKVRMRPIDSRTLDDGLAYLTYERVRAA